MLQAAFDQLLLFLRNNAINAAVLAVFVTVIAYIHAPRLKTLIFSMPVPFTCAYLASGIEIGSSHISGLVLVTFYHWIVYAIVRRGGKPLALGIGVGVSFYIGAAALVRPFVLDHVHFVTACAAVVPAWGIAVWQYRPINEPGHRSTAPWWIKTPVIFVIALGIFALTGLLGGAVTTFPYAGVFTSYEMRRSLRTLAGQYTINNLSFFLMFVTIYALEQQDAGLTWRLLAGWAVLVTTLGAIYHFGWGRAREPVPAGE